MSDDAGATPAPTTPGSRTRAASVPPRDRGLGTGLLALLGTGLGWATIRFDHGWFVWIVAMLLVAAAVATAIGLSTGRRRVAVLVSAVCILAAGSAAVHEVPLVPSQGWGLAERPKVVGRTLPEMVGASGSIVVFRDGPRLVGRSAESGDEVWSAPDVAADAELLVVGDVVHSRGTTLWPASAPSSALDARTGEVLHTIDTGGVEQVVVSGDVVAYLGRAGTEARDVGTGALLWEGAPVCAYPEAARAGSRDGFVVTPGLVLVAPHGDCSLIDSVMDVRTGSVLAQELFDASSITTDTHVVTVTPDRTDELTGHPITSGTAWTTRIADQIDEHGDPELVLELGTIRVSTTNGVVHLDPATGERHDVPLPDGFTFVESTPYDTSGDAFRHLLVEDDDGVALFDSVSGTVVDLPVDDVDGLALHAAGDRTAVSVLVADAVGRERRLWVVADGDSAEPVELWTDEARGTFTGNAILTERGYVVPVP